MAVKVPAWIETKAKLVPTRVWITVSLLACSLLVSRIGLEAFLTLGWWFVVVGGSGIHFVGVKKVALALLVFGIYVILPVYALFLLQPAIYFFLKFIFCLVIGTVSLAVILSWLMKPVDNSNKDVAGSTSSPASNSEATFATTQPEENSVPEQEAKSKDKKLGKSFSHEDANICVICQTEPKCVVFLPCAHLCVCNDCRNKLLEISTNCPICRRTITDSMLVYT